MKRRIILIAIVVAILGTVTVGTWWYIRQTTGLRLRTRAEVAIAAGKFDKALDLATRYVAESPDDWRGRYVMASALTRLGRYEEARSALAKAKELNESEPSIGIALARTRSLPAARSLEQRGTLASIPALDGAIGQLRQANEELLTIETGKPAEKARVLEELGLNRRRIGWAFAAKQRRLQEEAKIAAAARDEAGAKAKRKESRKAFRASEDAYEKAIATLLDAIPQDPSRDLACRTFVDLCVAREDEESLAKARDVLLSEEVPPSAPAIRLALYEVQSRPEDAQRRERLTRYCKRVDDWLKQHEAALEVKHRRAEAAAELGNIDTAERLCEELLKGNKRHEGALLLKAQLLMRKQRWAEAEDVLFLLTDAAGPPAAHYLYGLAAAGSGKKEVAATAMRRVTELVPGHPGARRFLAESLFNDGIYKEAFADAQVYYQAHPGDPRALGLFVRCASRTDQPELAKKAPLRVEQAGRPAAEALSEAGRLKGRPDAVRKALRNGATKALEALAQLADTPEQATDYRERLAWLKGEPEFARQVCLEAARDYPYTCEMLLEVGHAWSFLREEEHARKAWSAAADGKPKTAADRFAQREALRLVGRIAEAEKLMVEALAKSPADPALRFQLGRLFLATGRYPQAVAEFQKALELDPQRDEYRLALARCWFDLGDLEQCGALLEMVSRRNAEANALLLHVRLAKAKPEDAEKIAEQAGAAPGGGLALATRHLSMGRPDQCIAVCREELKRAPDDAGWRYLLGQAYRTKGDRPKCVEQWTLAVRSAPERVLFYRDLAGVLAEDLEVRQVEKKLLGIAGPRPYMADLAMGWLHARRREFDEAAKGYARVAQRPGATPALRHLGRLGQAEALAASGKIEAALSELNQLPKTPLWRDRALWAKFEVLRATGRREEAAGVLAGLRRDATDRKDIAALRRIASSYARIARPDEALAVCTEATEVSPNDPATYLLRAGLLTGTGRRAEAVPLLEKAIELQPGNLTAYLALARTLEADGLPRRALDVLGRMEKERGKAGRATALFQGGLMLSRLGLHDQARVRFEQLAALDEARMPALELGLGRALAALGQRNAARKALQAVPAYSSEFLPAQQLLVDLAEDDKERLAILDRLESARPEHAGVVAQKMEAHIRAGRAGEAVKAFRSFLARRGANRPLSSRAGLPLVRLLDAAKDTRAAAELAARMAKMTADPLWRQLGILLNLEGKPDVAASLLPPRETARIPDAIHGLLVSAHRGDARSAQQWADRMDELEQQRARVPSAKPLFPPYKILASLAAGRVQQATTELANLQGGGSPILRAAEELAAFAAGKPGPAAAEAARLLKASMAIDLGLPEIGRRWSVELLRARPTCQWAAALIARTRADAAAHEEVLNILRPPDSTVARVIRGLLLMSQAKYEQAADVYRRAAEVEKDDFRLVLSRAVALEKAGKLSDALALYQSVWQASQEPVAANNAAYMVTQLFPKDGDRLRQALGWLEAAIKAPGAPAEFYDTKAWIEYLLGRKKEALADARRAIRGTPESLEVHYHLGAIELDAGDQELGRWHLEAAVARVDAIQASGRTPTVSEANAAKLARAALAGIGRKQE